MPYTIRRVKSKFAKGITDSGQGWGQMRRNYPSEDAALTRVCEDLAAIASAHRIDPQPSAIRKGDSITITADAAGFVYVVSKRAHHGQLPLPEIKPLGGKK